MCDIKFRAWVNGFLPAQSGMFYGIDLYRNTISGGYDRIGVWRNNNRYHFKSEEEPFELMQYTGLKDKNGVEIYEGDILGLVHKKHGIINKQTVVWDSEAAAYGWETTNDDSWPDGFSGFMDEYEVIGNIYENPELLSV